MLLQRVHLKTSTSSFRRLISLKSSAVDRSNQDSTQPEITYPPRNARVVVCGGGVMGASVAYHIGKLGWGTDTVLIDQNR